MLLRNIYVRLHGVIYLLVFWIWYVKVAVECNSFIYERHFIFYMVE
jgi:hypothetical protein